VIIPLAASVAVPLAALGAIVAAYVMGKRRPAQLVAVLRETNDRRLECLNKCLHALDQERVAHHGAVTELTAKKIQLQDALNRANNELTAATSMLETEREKSARLYLQATEMGEECRYFESEACRLSDLVTRRQAALAKHGEKRKQQRAEARAARRAAVAATTEALRQGVEEKQEAA
jgi:hypothetical protein